MSIFSRKKPQLNVDSSSENGDLLRTYSTHLSNIENSLDELQLLSTQVKGLSEQEMIMEIQELRRKLIIIKQSHDILSKHSRQKYQEFRRKITRTYENQRYKYNELSFYLPIKLLNQRKEINKNSFSSFVGINFEILSLYYEELKDFVKFLSEK